MIRGRAFATIVVVLFILSISAIVSAEVREGAFTLSPHVGGYVFEGKQNLSNGPVYGLGFGYNYTKNLGVEFVFDYVDTNLEPDRPGKGRDIAGLIYRIDALYHLVPDKQLVPYISAGVGAITLDKIDTSFLLSPAVGIKYFLTKNLIFRTEGRYLLSLRDDSRNNFAYTFGLSYLFGGRKEKPAPPPPPPPQDSDGDGVNDEFDKCPDTPAGVSVDNDGCPKDSDRDGVPDYMDKCPGTPSGVSVDSAGCPGDRDGDGVPDYLDKCPDTPGVVDFEGCPPPVKEIKVIVLEDVHFAYNKATLTEEAQMILSNNIQLLKENPDITILIEGHSCAHGNEDYNLRLSERRANAVKEYLVAEGDITEDRMNTIAYGESRLAMPEIPTPNNRNSAEAKANRRVHFKVIVH